MSTHAPQTTTTSTLAYMPITEARRTGVDMKAWRAARDARTARMHAADRVSLIRVDA